MCVLGTIVAYELVECVTSEVHCVPSPSQKLTRTPLLMFYMKVGSFFFLDHSCISFLPNFSTHKKKMWGAQHISCLTRHVCHVRPPVQDIITVLPGAIWPAWWCAVEVAVAALHSVNLSPVWDRRRRVASRWCFLALINWANTTWPNKVIIRASHTVGCPFPL